MVLVVHHLGIAQSERIVWLCEELEIPYKLVKHTRDPLMAPDSLKSVAGNHLGKAPFINDEDTGVTLQESGAIVEYILQKYGKGKLSVSPNEDSKAYATYLYWFHFASGTLQPAMQTDMFIGLIDLADDAMVKNLVRHRVHATLQQVDDRLKDSKWLAGDEFTAADVMTIYSLTTQRYYGLASLAPYKNILRYLQDCAGRDGYKRAMEKGDPEMRPLISADPPAMSLIAAGGIIKSDVWKK